MKKITTILAAATLLALASCNGGGNQHRFPPGKVIDDSTEIIVSDSAAPQPATQSEQKADSAM